MKLHTKRKYELKQRADEMAEMRLRITEAAVELHGTIGPARTTMSAIAKRAGVQRHTVYRHFPTDDDLFSACSTHYATSNPLPDPEPWRAIGDPRGGWLERSTSSTPTTSAPQPMFSNVLRDPELVDAVGPALTPAARLPGGSVPDPGSRLADPRTPAARARRRAATTSSTSRPGARLPTGDRITRAEAVEVATALVTAAAGARPGARA